MDDIDSLDYHITPNSFQRMMVFAFSGLKSENAFLYYIGDFVVLGCMLPNLTNVFELCREHKLKLHTEKFSFFRAEVTYLGQKFTDKGILADG